MIELTMNWDAMTPGEKTQWLSHYILGAEQNFEFGENKDSHWLVHQCNEKIKVGENFNLWIRNATSEVSAHVYSGLTDAQIQHPDTIWPYYAFMYSCPIDIQSRVLYFSHRGLSV